MRYRVIYEKSPRNYGAWSPDLLGCVATAKTLHETRRNMREAMACHRRLMLEDGEIVPPITGYVETKAYGKKRAPASKPKAEARPRRRRPA